MKKYLLSSLLLVSLLSCTTAVKKPEETPAPIPSTPVTTLPEVTVKPEVEAPKPSEPEAPVTVVVPGGTATESTTVKTPTEVIKVETVPEQVEMKSQYAVKSTLSWIKEQAEVANCVINNPDFIAEVKAHGVFDLAKKGDKKGPTGPAVAAKMVKFTPVVVTSYCKKPAFGYQTNAYRNVGSNVIYMNTCVGLNPLKERVNTMVHERLHVVGYGHGDNSSVGKDNTVPYGVGDMSEKYAAKCKLSLVK